MVGAEHYVEAERLLKAAEMDMMAGRGAGNIQEHDQQVARAKVHALLAVADASAHGRYGAASENIADAEGD